MTKRIYVAGRDFAKLPLAIRRRNLSYRLEAPTRSLLEDIDAGLICRDRPAACVVHWNRKDFRISSFHLPEQCGKNDTCYRVWVVAAIRKQERMPLRDLSGHLSFPVPMRRGRIRGKSAIRSSPTVRVRAPRKISGCRYERLLDALVRGDKRAKRIFSSFRRKNKSK